MTETEKWKARPAGRRTVSGEGARKIGELSIKLVEAALIARERGDDVHVIFFATKAAETLQLARLLGWQPGAPDKEQGDGR